MMTAAPAAPAAPASAGEHPAPPLRPGMRVHLVGVAGAGMIGLARALAQWGARISGSDLRATPGLDALRRLGVEVHVGHDTAFLPSDVELVVRSPAIPASNPELEAARQRGIPVVKRGEMLGRLVAEKRTLAVAGTHGKTTTTGMIAHVLAAAGQDPAYFVGGLVASLGANAQWGRGPWAVVEADEYDRAFLSLRPEIAVITNVEHDHPDLYPDLDAVVDAFSAFAARVVPSGLLLAWAGSDAARRATQAARARVAWYAVEGDPADFRDLDWTATDRMVSDDGQSFEVSLRGESLGRWQIRLAGRHNVANALAAVAALDGAGVDHEIAKEALATYRGARRRFQTLGTIGGITVMDDYAHHPTEIRATLEAARETFPERPLWVVLQPHTFSRVAALTSEFALALDAADRTFVTPVYGAREAPLPGVTAASVAGRVPGAVVASSPEDAARRAVAEAPSGTVLLFLGAGDIPAGSRAAVDLLAETGVARLLDMARESGLDGSVQAGEPLSRVTTLRVGGPATLMVRVKTTADLEGWWRLALRVDLPLLVVGRGSNLLASDAGFTGCVLVNRCEAWRLEAMPAAPGESEPDQAVVVAESGVTLAALGQALARQGWAGLEAGVGIPGSLGAAAVTNAGAHGWSMADSLISARGLGPEGEPRTWSADALRLRYRESALKGSHDHLITHVSLRVRRDAPAEIQRRIAEFAQLRRRTQPNTPSVGSMFKNPPGDFAGRLIEAAGLKGHAVGGARISEIHANFFVNAGTATAADVDALIATARDAVAEAFGVRLDLEIERLGGDDG